MILIKVLMTLASVFVPVLFVHIATGEKYAILDKVLAALLYTMGIFVCLVMLVGTVALWVK